MGLTAARFDLLYLIRSQTYWMPASQGDLHRILGVCRSVISRMLKSLEALGYVRRERCDYDGRRRVVSLTKVGRARILRGIRQFMTWGFVRLGLASVLVDEAARGAWWDDGKALSALDDADAFFRKLRDGFGDTATLKYPPWHPGYWPPTSL
jgi:DNA-binding MarR family transcriptional regulator